MPLLLKLFLNPINLKINLLQTFLKLTQLHKFPVTKSLASFQWQMFLTFMEKFPFTTSKH
ncbi:Uncharacterised protein [Actinobacillus ureae]|nr:Uncharacterised protein [Actinobacillus ureae]SUU46712.1 Uncharacterised protein [Actinobacillus ureae]